MMMMMMMMMMMTGTGARGVGSKGVKDGPGGRGGENGSRVAIRVEDDKGVTASPVTFKAVVTVPGSMLEGDGGDAVDCTVSGSCFIPKKQELTMNVQNPSIETSTGRKVRRRDSGKGKMQLQVHVTAVVLEHGDNTYEFTEAEIIDKVTWRGEDPVLGLV
jgi:hypothetical protein